MQQSETLVVRSHAEEESRCYNNNNNNFHLHSFEPVIQEMQLQMLYNINENHMHQGFHINVDMRVTLIIYKANCLNGLVFLNGFKSFLCPFVLGFVFYTHDKNKRKKPRTSLMQVLFPQRGLHAILVSINLETV